MRETTTEQVDQHHQQPHTVQRPPVHATGTQPGMMMTADHHQCQILNTPFTHCIHSRLLFDWIIFQCSSWQMTTASKHSDWTNVLNNTNVYLLTSKLVNMYNCISTTDTETSERRLRSRLEVLWHLNAVNAWCSSTPYSNDFQHNCIKHSWRQSWNP